MSDTAHCSRCHQDKPASEFYADSRRSTGVSSRCRECEREHLGERYAANPEIQKAHAAKWREENREAKRTADREYDKTRTRVKQAA